MRVHLINEFVRRGVQVDLLMARLDSPYLQLLAPSVQTVATGTSHAVSSVLPIATYLRRSRPDVVLAQRIRVDVATLRARWLARLQTPIYATINTNLTRQLESLRPKKRAKQLRLMRRYYPRNDGLIAVSRGVAEDAARLLNLSPEWIQSIPNPSVPPGIDSLVKAPVPHPWLNVGERPVILGVGRLEPQKDFTTLLQAFARVRAQRECRLIILGEGQLREGLLSQAQDLGIRQDLALPGFADNPYAWMARARLFVLSSRWEGSPNSLVEALAVGTPVVATDCPNGPREILEDGRHGTLVPVGDHAALAGAILREMDTTPEPEGLRRAAERYSAARSAALYLKAMGLP